MKTGDSIDRFTILKKLGHGGMGGVFIGFDHQSNELVAVKVLFQEYSDDPIYVKRFQREVEILRKLQHPNVVGLIDAGEDKGTHYMALEYVRGRTLVDLIFGKKRPNLDTICRIVKDIARGLAYAHSNGIVHRDIKPANIMVLDSTGVAKVLDFGVARAEDQNLQTSEGRFVGTLSYAAPEQSQGKPIDERADLYAMGLVFYELLTGRRAITANNATAILQQQLNDAYVPPSQVEPSLPPDVNHLVMKLLRSDLNQRYTNGNAFLYDLEVFESRSRSASLNARSVYDFPEFVKQFQEANAAFEAKDLDHSLQLCQDLARKAPRAAEVFFLLGRLHQERGFVYNAIKEFIKATAFDPENAYYHMSLGLAYQSLNMQSQAKSEFETALHLDPNSLVVKQRLADLERGKGARPVVVPSAPDPEKVEKLYAVDDDEVHAQEARKKAQEAFVTRLTDLRPHAVDPQKLAFNGAAWWGWAFHDLNLKSRMLRATALQVVLGAIALYVLTHPTFFAGLMEKHPTLNLGFLKDPTIATRCMLVLYAAGCVYFYYESLRVARLYAYQGFVIQEPTERNWIAINVGRDRGVKPRQLFMIYKEQPRGSGKGVFVGQLVVKDVEDALATGPYYPDTRQAPTLGDYALAQESLRAGVVDLDVPDTTRFPSSLNTSVPDGPFAQAAAPAGSTPSRPGGPAV